MNNEKDVKPIGWTTVAAMFVLFLAPMAMFLMLYYPVFGDYFGKKSVVSGIWLYMGGMALCYFCGYLAMFIKRNTADSFKFWDHQIGRLGKMSLDTHIAICAEDLAKKTRQQVVWVRKSKIEEDDGIRGENDSND